jgi:hypothetical protein
MCKHQGKSGLDLSSYPHARADPSATAAATSPLAFCVLLLRACEHRDTRLQAADALGAKREQLLALRLCAHPVFGWLQIAATLLAPQNCHLKKEAIMAV